LVVVAIVQQLGVCAAPDQGRAGKRDDGWLIERYREVGAWTTLSPATRRQRENIFKHVLENAGEKAIASIKTATIMAGIERRRQLRPEIS
jgi:hypothetical protein